ncbi:4'-phosphopantetheinyl transferase family protein [Janthinobacterium aquaticum]|uniref:4'-phosphopantetheinyl transferase family protein n=1 Tax=Janthinobacterium sp. FT58W TaxID=2654254 RepID=UPI00186B005B|nr:4'-phosphopantetheinyl transferase superfamily protein [Janthinobacterium sp. FT58W]
MPPPPCNWRSAARGALRAVLAHYTHSNPADLAFTQSRWGKPALTTGELEFNLSHSDDLALLAVASAGCPVGIDIESLEQHRLDVATLFDLTCHDSEKAALLAISGDAQRHAFMALWTRKEAYLKALGLGLQADLHEVTFSQHAQIGCWGVDGQARRGNAPWQVRTLEMAGDMWAVYACRILA